MARKVRIEYPGEVYHVMYRADRREAIFRNDADRELFLLTLGRRARSTDRQVHAYGLMENHFHLVVDSASPGYLRTVWKYAHQNPVRAKLPRLEESLRASHYGEELRESATERT